MIHIVFQEPDINTLQQAIALDHTLTGDVILIRDDLAVGPLENIYDEAGIMARQNWWKEVLAGGDYDGKAEDGSVNDGAVVADLLQNLSANPEETVWIWAAQNGHDVCGYYWLMSQLKEYQGRIYILYLNNLPFFNEKGNIFYPTRLAVIPAKEFLKAKKLARIITPSEFEVDPDEWKKICSQPKPVRLLEGGKKLGLQEEDFYDDDLRKQITGEWMRASKIIHHYLSKAPHATGDAYLLWRLKKIIQSDAFEIQGELKGMKDFEVRRKSITNETT